MPKLDFVKVGKVYECDITLKKEMRLHIERGDHTPVQCFEAGSPEYKYGPSKNFNLDTQEPLVTTLETSVYPAYLKLKCIKKPKRAWLLDSGEVPEPEVTSVVVDNQQTEPFAIPENMAEYVDVKVLRKAITNSYNVLCLPFDVPHETFLEVFGNGSFIIEPTEIAPNGNVLASKYVMGIEAGKPYIIQPSDVHTEDFYVFPHIKSDSFVDKPKDLILNEGWGFYGTFIKMVPAPTDFYIFSKGTFYHYDSAVSLAGTMAYIKKK